VFGVLLLIHAAYLRRATTARYYPFDDYKDKIFLTVDECSHEVTGAGKTIKIATKFKIVYCI